MLEILYDIHTNEVRAWNADINVQGNLNPKVGQHVIILPIAPPNFASDIYYIDLVNQKVVGNPTYIEPAPPRNLVAEIDDLKARVKKLEEPK